MNQNKFLNNINQKPTATAPVATAITPPPPTGAYDPIQRLVEELSRHSQAIEGLNRRFDNWEKQPKGATLGELATLVEEVRQGVRVNVNTNTLAQALLPELTKQMPTAANLKGAIEEGVNKLRAVGLAAAEQIDQTSRGAASRIERASGSQANAWANRIGFISWQSALLVFVLLMVVGGGIAFYLQSHQAEIQAMRVQDNAIKEFVSWIQEKYPQVWKTYLKKVNP